MEKKRHNTRRRNFWIFIIIMVLLSIYLYIRWETSKRRQLNIPPSSITEPQFKKEGELSFLNQQGDTITNIDIEIADQLERRMQGLMYRSKMAMNRGMLFIFDEQEEQDFWMKNTKISLDIIYINSDKHIVTIYKHTEPYSETPIPSFKPAMYVVEVNGGFCDKYGIKEGDEIAFHFNSAISFLPGFTEKTGYHVLAMR